MSISKKLVYLPIETKSREFDAKCLIALGCIERGMAVIISAAGASKIDLPGVALLKSAAGFEKENIVKLKRQNIKCAVIDEEGFVQTKNEKQRALRYSQETIDLVDQVFFNGEAEKQLLSKFYTIPDGKGRVTGNTRFDFYKPQFHPYYQEQADNLKKKYGKYILLPSRFGEVKSARKIGYLDFLKNNIGIKSESDLDIFRSFLSHSQKIYQEFLDLLPLLSRQFPDYTIIVRPHPSENRIPWEDIAVNLENVKVVSDGPIGPWLLGASAVLHNGCTTGLEAFVMEKPVFSFMPYTSAEFDLQLPNDVSMKFTDREDLFSGMRLILNDPLQHKLDKDQATKSDLARNFVQNASAEFAYKIICDELNELSNKVEPICLSSIRHQSKVKFINKLRKIRTYLAVIFGKFKLPMPKILEDGFYVYHKNPGFNSSEILINFSKLSNCMQINEVDIRLRKIDEDVFLVYQQTEEVSEAK